MKRLTLLMLLCSILTSCLQIMSLPPTRIVIDSVGKSVYNPYLWGEDTVQVYYTRILLKRRAMYMGFLEKKGLKHPGDTAIIIKKRNTVKIIK